MRCGIAPFDEMGTGISVPFLWIRSEFFQEFCVTVGTQGHLNMNSMDASFRRNVYKDDFRGQSTGSGGGKAYHWYCVLEALNKLADKWIKKISILGTHLGRCYPKMYQKKPPTHPRPRLRPRLPPPATPRRKKFTW